MTEDEIVEYATHSPENTNPAVLRDMLGQLSGGGSAAFLICEMEGTDYHRKLDKTYGEIFAAMSEHTPVIIFGTDSSGGIIMGIISRVGKFDDGGVEKISFQVNWTQSWQFLSGLPDDYPEEDPG